MRAAFPDFHNTIEGLIADGDTVAAHLTYRGTHTGELFCLRPTGRRVTYTGLALFHLKADGSPRAWSSGTPGASWNSLAPSRPSRASASGHRPDPEELCAHPRTRQEWHPAYAYCRIEFLRTTARRTVGMLP